MVQITIRMDARLVRAKIARMNGMLKVVGTSMPKTYSGKIRKKWKAKVKRYNWTEGGSRAYNSIHAFQTGKREYTVRGGNFEELGFMETGSPIRKNVNIYDDPNLLRWVSTKLMRKNPKAAKIIISRGRMSIGKGHSSSAFRPGGRQLLERSIKEVGRSRSSFIKENMKKIVRA